MSGADPERCALTRTKIHEMIKQNQSVTRFSKSACPLMSASTQSCKVCSRLPNVSHTRGGIKMHSKARAYHINSPFVDWNLKASRQRSLCPAIPTCLDLKSVHTPALPRKQGLPCCYTMSQSA